MSQFPLNLRALRDDSLFYHVLPWLPCWSPRPQLNLAAAAFRCVTYNSYDGFLSHRGTPSYHPLIDWDFPWNKPSFWGYPCRKSPQPQLAEQAQHLCWSYGVWDMAAWPGWGRRIHSNAGAQPQTEKLMLQPWPSRYENRSRESTLG